MKKIYWFIFLFFVPLYAQSVYQAHYDNNSTGTTTTEVQLTPTNVVSGKFGFKCKFSVDENVFAQPLYAPGITISGIKKELAIIATMNDSVYAFDADTCAIVWQVSLGSPWPFSAYEAGIPEGNTGQWMPVPNMGCFSTPVLDLTNNVLYISCVNSTPHWTLFKLNLLTGATINSVVMGGQVVGTGDTGSGHTGCGYRGVPDPTSGPNLLFFPQNEIQRPGLKFANGNIYAAFSGIGDECPYHGWVMAYNTSLSQVGIWCSTPNGWGGGIWNGEIAIDGSGNIYVTTGNGSAFDGSTTFTNTTLKFSSSLTLLDWFEPSNNVSIDNADADVSSNRFVLVPGTHFGVISAKDFNVYVLDTTCMGHLQGSSGCSLQTFQTNSSGTPTSSSGAYGAVLANNILYLPTTAGSIYAFTWTGSSFITTPVWTQTNSYGFPGPAQMAVSLNGVTNGILWIVTATSSSYSSDHIGILHALNPANGSEYWNSNTLSTDNSGFISKFSTPTIVNGKILIPTQSNYVMEYSLFPSGKTRGTASFKGSIR